MNFAKLFGKKDKGGGKTKQDNAGQTTLMLDQKIKDLELRISNLETKTNALQEEAKAKLRAGDKAGAKRILGKKKKYMPTSCGSPACRVTACLLHNESASHCARRG